MVYCVWCIIKNKINGDPNKSDVTQIVIFHLNKY